jgi:hypothetical protein
MSELERRKSILELSYSETRDFLLKAESYCSVDLPPYFVFKGLIEGVHKQLDGKKLTSLSNNPRDYDDVNYTILNNKDGKYAWRPFQLIHPALYVSLVHHITEEANWNLIIERFNQFSANQKIRCLSLPVVSQSEEKDKAEQVSHWWHEVEQRSIELALEYDCLLETDITDCYGAIYTHSIAWALHTKTEAKKREKRTDLKLIGNQIDKHIQDMRHGQTNGIPQGSVLVDFIAEMVLGYADLKLSERIQATDISDYLILHYRDDYRIFANNPPDGEQIIKLLTEVTILLGLKLNPSKTRANDDVVRASIKADKIAWFSRKKSEKSLQKHLLIIHNHALQFPNAGSLAVALQNYYNRLVRVKELLEEPLPLFRGFSIKHAFLEGCQRAGLFEAIAEGGSRAMTFAPTFTITNRMTQAITRIERVRSAWHRFWARHFRDNFTTWFTTAICDRAMTARMVSRHITTRIAPCRLREDKGGKG